MITIKKHTVQKAFKKLTRTPKQKSNAKKKLLKKRTDRAQKKQQMISMFGKWRYYLSLLFGQWILWHKGYAKMHPVEWHVFRCGIIMPKRKSSEQRIVKSS